MRHNTCKCRMKRQRSRTDFHSSILPEGDIIARINWRGRCDSFKSYQAGWGLRPWGVSWHGSWWIDLAMAPLLPCQTTGRDRCPERSAAKRAVNGLS